jgi:hypothetical protein
MFPDASSSEPGLAEPAAPPGTPAASEPDAALRPPQFTLRTLLVTMTAVAILMGVMTAVGSFWSLGLLLLLALVGAHVIGNAVGTRLRDRAPRRGSADDLPSEYRAAPPREIIAPQRLTQPARLHWINLVMAVLGAGMGSYFGGAALASGYPDAPLSAVVLGYVSSAVLGGFAGFATSSFVSVMRQALSEAHAAAPPDPPQKRG